MINSILGTFTLRNKGEYFELGQREIARCYFLGDSVGLKTILEEYQGFYGSIEIEDNNPDAITLILKKSHNRYPWSREEVL